MDLNSSHNLYERIDSFLRKRREDGTFRQLRTSESSDETLDLSNNDYLCLAKHPLVCQAACRAIEEDGCSSSASPLLTGYRSSHAALVETICAWFGSSRNQVMLWNTGYSANQSIFNILPQKKDIVLADKMIHQSMIAGILSSGARLIRYPHLDIPQLESLLARYSENRNVFVATESVFGMDGDYPDLRKISQLRKKFGFFWILDEAHALGWYGQKGTGLAEEQGVLDTVDLFLGTMGKALGSSGAFTIFKNPQLKDYMVNVAGHFIYSTFLPPSAALAAKQAIELLVGWESERKQWQNQSNCMRATLNRLGHFCGPGDSPVIPMFFNSLDDLDLAKRKLGDSRISVSAIRHPTVPVHSPRIRISMRRDMNGEDLAGKIHEGLK